MLLSFNITSWIKIIYGVTHGVLTPWCNSLYWHEIFAGWYILDNMTYPTNLTFYGKR